MRERWRCGQCGTVTSYNSCFCSTMGRRVSDRNAPRGWRFESFECALISGTSHGQGAPSVRCRTCSGCQAYYRSLGY